MADDAIKSFKFWVLMVYAPKIAGERCYFYWQLVLYLDDPEWLVLVDDSKAILDPKKNRVSRSANRLDRYKSSLIDDGQA